MDRDGLLLEDEVAAMLQNLASYHAHRAAGSSGSSSGGTSNGSAGGGGQHRAHRYGTCLESRGWLFAVCFSPSRIRLPRLWVKHHRGVGFYHG